MLDATPPLLAILDYGMGNLHSAHKGFALAGADARLTADPAEILSADGIVLPGVGAFGPSMAALTETGLATVACERIESGVPFFGVCIGMQVLYAGSDEAPGVAGLGVFPEHVRQLPPTEKRPQMQWNQVHATDRNHPMLSRFDTDPWMYFVHSYAADPGESLLATCDYGGAVTAAVARDNLWACQFHPEKSGRNGIEILKSFVDLARAYRNAPEMST